jgi:ADP-heptose:LPS heptosyltransferase
LKVLLSFFYKVLHYLVVSIRVPLFRKRLLIVRLDAIGDYVLFRNCISEIKNSKRFKGFKIYLLGNVAFKDLAEKFDSSFVDEFIWVRPHELRLTFRRLKILLKLKAKFFHTILNPSHTRFPEIDIFFNEIYPKNLIGSKGDNEKFPSKKDKELCDSFYTELIDVPGIGTFEFVRNVVFLKKLLYQEKTNIDLSLPSKSKQTLKSNNFRIIVVPGAGAPYRVWPAKKFASVIDILGEEFKLKCDFIISGSKEEDLIADEIKKNLRSQSVTSLCGSISLAELVDLISEADLVISNETSAVHIAAATTTPVVCISNGHHFGRFNKYPKEVSNCVVTVYPNEDFYDESKYDELVEMNKNDKNLLDIDAIGVEPVILAAKQLLMKAKGSQF